jgi:hypothetical protein
LESPKGPRQLRSYPKRGGEVHRFEPQADAAGREVVRHPQRDAVELPQLEENFARVAFQANRMGGLDGRSFLCGLVAPGRSQSGQQGRAQKPSRNTHDGRILPFERQPVTSARPKPPRSNLS